LQANRESLDANFASSNAAVFLGGNRPVGFHGLRQDLEGFLSVERKGLGCSPLGRAEGTLRKENFSARREITFYGAKDDGGLISHVAETILRKRDDFADVAGDSLCGSGREFSLTSSSSSFWRPFVTFSLRLISL